MLLLDTNVWLELLLEQNNAQALRTSLRQEFGDKTDALASSIRQDFGSEMRALRNEFGSEMQAVRSEFGSEMRALRNEFGSEMRALRNEFGERTDALAASLRQEFGEKFDEAKRHRGVLYEDVLHRIDLVVEGLQALHQRIDKLEAGVAHEFIETRSFIQLS